jgi:hypothetical protein
MTPASPKALPVLAQVDISPADIQRSLSDEELVDFIIGLDNAAGSWDVTLRLAEHFAALKIEHSLEEAAERMGKGGQP